MTVLYKLWGQFWSFLKWEYCNCVRLNIIADEGILFKRKFSGKAKRRKKEEKKRN